MVEVGLLDDILRYSLGQVPSLCSFQIFGIELADDAARILNELKSVQIIFGAVTAEMIRSPAASQRAVV